jgi:hypothetical protein
MLKADGLFLIKEKQCGIGDFLKQPWSMEAAEATSYINNNQQMKIKGLCCSAVWVKWHYK